MKPSFGDRLVTSKRLVRGGKRIAETGLGSSASTRYWIEKSIVEGETEVIFLGQRTLSNGFKELDSEYGWIYTPKEHFRAWLVCAEKRKPFYIMPLGVTP